MNAHRATKMAPSTLSQHLSSLEEIVGQKLCEADRFRLTRAGRKFWLGLEAGMVEIKSSWDALCAEMHPVQHFGAPEVITRHYLPGTVEKLEARYQHLRCSTESATEFNLERMLADDEVHFVVATEGPLWRKYTSAGLASLPIGLVCADRCPHRSVAALWAQGVVKERLYVSGSCEAAIASFDRGLSGLGVRWPERRQVSSMLSVIEDVAAGRGLGLAVKVPGLLDDRRIRFLALPHFAPVQVAAFWKGGMTAIHRSAVGLLRALAKEMRIARKGCP